MRVPGSVRRVKPNEIVVFEKHGGINTVPYNACFQTEDGTLCFFDTEHYETSAEPHFFCQGSPDKIYDYQIDDIRAARALMQEGITPHDLREHMHDFEWVADILRKDLEKEMNKAWENLKDGK